MTEVRVVGIPKAGQVTIVCSECGPVVTVDPRWAPLRMLAHYHHHEQEPT